MVAVTAVMLVAGGCANARASIVALGSAGEKGVSGCKAKLALSAILWVRISAWMQGNLVLE